MSLSCEAISTANAERSSPSVALESERLVEVRETLRELFGYEPWIVDTASDAVISSGVELSQDLPPHWLPICREVAQRGRAEFIADESPLLALALPIPAAECRYVAVGLFLAHRCTKQSSPDTAARIARLCEAWGLSRTTADWLARQIPWPAERLMAVAKTTVQRWTAASRAESLGAEVADLAVQLGSLYEEISLLHRLTRHLRISENDEQLGRLTLDWLADTLPAKSLVIELFSRDAADSETALSPTVFLTHGDAPLDEQRFKRLVGKLGGDKSPRMQIVNAPPAELAEELDGIDSFVLAPLMEGTNLFGWVAAFGHRAGAEFGSSEASLLASIGALLGIHCGNLALYREQADMLAGVVRALTSAIDAKDPYTCGHSDRVARLSVALAQELGCDQKQLETIYLSGLLHDVGKIGVDDQVLRKPGRLSDSEFEHIKIHTEIGFRILRDLKQLGDVLPVVRHHHEAWNGTGYPSALAGEDIPLLARVVAVADAFDAMSSDRPYRKGMPDEKLDEILRSGAGRQWDTRVIDAYFRIREKIGRIVRPSGEREPLPEEVRRLS
jgi:putative nucleotidyltransferase with HDIG domain